MSSPELSVIVITLDTIQPLKRLLQALSRQTARSRIEIVLAGPDDLSVDNAEHEFADFGGHQVIQCPGSLSTSVLRAVAIRAAKAPVIALTEEHCFPARHWAETFIERHREDWAGVGGVFVNGNPATIASSTNFLIEYGPVAHPLPSGEIGLIAGHNSSYKRDVLLDNYGDRLEGMLDVEPAMQWDLQAKGHRFFNDDRAKAVHYNVSRFDASVRLRFHCGRLFAGHRASRWRVLKRLAYTVASPLIPVVRLCRTWCNAHRIGMAGRFLRMSPLVALFLCLDGLGECVGYLAGPGRSLAELEDMEMHRERFLHPQDRPQYLQHCLEAASE
jgi:hypothetical protein